ncbi:MAG: tRNA dihydrouridine synthase [Solirubrobacteraceae bacterium]
MAVDSGKRLLSEPWELGGLRVPNRIMLAPLAGIGNWFVRLQAKRYGAGMAVSEMVSSHAIHYGNRRTLSELLRIDPREREAGPGAAAGSAGPISIQLFGADPEVMRSAARTVARAGADVIDLNMGCPVPKVCRTGAGAALLSDPDRAVALARAARQGGGLPVTVKLRSGLRVGDRSGLELAERLVAEAGVAAIAIHPRAASTRHAGSPDYALVRDLVERLPAPVILTGGLREAGRVHELFELTGVAAVMLARGALGNPWLFARVAAFGSGAPAREPTRREILGELDWLLDRAAEHLGEQRAARYLRKFYPWYLSLPALRPAHPASVRASLQAAPTLGEARETLAALAGAPPAAAQAA